MRDLFAKARKAAPAIIFIDEFDAAGRKRGAGIGQGNDEREQTLNALLVEMDGFSGDGGLVVMGATNRPDILDPALLRPGRFDRQVTIDVPDVHGRLEILRLHGSKRPLGPDVSLEEIAHQTPGFSGAELANVINEAALLSVRDANHEIDQATLEESIDRVVAGPAKKHILTREERWLISVHEASHAVVTDALGHTSSTRKLSIVARGRTLGTAAHMLTDRDQVIQTEFDLQRQLIVIVAGTAGERIAFGSLSTGVSDDLHAATSLARSMVTSFGMSTALGPVTIGEKGGEVFLGASLQDLGSVGPSTLDLIDREVERLVGDAEATRRVHPRPPLERRRGDRQRAARAGDAVGRGARRRALDGAGDDARGTARRAPSRARARPGAQTLKRLAAGMLIAAAIASAGVASARGEASWRLEQPPPPEGAPFKVALGRVDDMEFYAPNEGLLSVEGNATVSDGLFFYNGRGWHQLSTVCGGAGEVSRIAWAGPDEFWTITEPSEPRVGSGLGLCHFKEGVVVGSYSTPLAVARSLPSARCCRLQRSERLLVCGSRQPGSLRGSASAPSICTGTGPA